MSTPERSPLPPCSRMVLGMVLLSVALGITHCAHDTPIEPAAVDPAPYLSPLEKALLQEINVARTEPQKYAAVLAPLQAHFVGTTLQQPGDIALATDRGAALVTREGVKAVQEAVDFLRTTSPLPPLVASRGMSLAAKDHVKDQGQAGQIGHQGSDGSRSEDRVNRYGRWQGKIGENIAYGISSARGMIMALIIDDGIPGRGHRHNLFEARSRVAGVACGPHRTWQLVCVLTFADGYIEGATP